MKCQGWGTVRPVILAAAVMTTLFIGVSPCFGTERARKSSVVMRPKRNEAVARNYEVVGKMLTSGQPLVLIRPEVDDIEWWLQPLGTVNEKGYFKSKVCFGSDRSKSGDRFEIVVVTLRSHEEAELFKGKEFVTELPESLLISNPVSVTLNKSSAAVSLAVDDSEDPVVESPVSADIVTRPSANSQVQTQTEIAGQLPAAGWPVVLIRSDDANDPWWVQGPARVPSDDSFTVQARFGNEQTANGTKFYVVVLILPTEEDAKKFEPGMTVADLPRGVPRSQEIAVALKRSAASAERNAKP